MTKSFTGTVLRSVAYIFATTSLCTVLNANAQETERYHIVDRPMLETLISSGSLDFQIPFLIVAPDDGMALQAVFNRTSTAMTPQSVTLQDHYAEPQSVDKTIQYHFTYQGESSANAGMIFKIINLNPYKYLGTSSDKFVLDGNNAKENFTFIFDETDDSRLQIQSEYYKSGDYYSINYTGAGDTEGFKLTADDSKGLSLYRLDYFNTTLGETPIDEGTGDIIVTLNPHKDLKGTVSYINYILNDGGEVSVDELLASGHYKEISWKGYTSGPLEISLPNYDPDATTIWAIPTIKYLDPVPNTPYGPAFQATYSDISTGISSPKTDTANTTPIYYTLQGIQISRPETPGIYLCRRGTEVSKIIIR